MIEIAVFLLLAAGVVIWAVAASRKRRREVAVLEKRGVHEVTETPERFDHLGVPPFGIGYSRKVDEVLGARPRGQQAWHAHLMVDADLTVGSHGQDVVVFDLPHALPWLYVSDRPPPRAGVRGRQLTGPPGLLIRGDDDRFAAAALDSLWPVLQKLADPSGPVGRIDLSVDTDAVVFTDPPSEGEPDRLMAWLDVAAGVAEVLSIERFAAFATPLPSTLPVFHGHPDWRLDEGERDDVLHSVPWPLHQRGQDAWISNDVVRGSVPGEFLAFSIGQQRIVEEVVSFAHGPIGEVVRSNPTDYDRRRLSHDSGSQRLRRERVGSPYQTCVVSMRLPCPMPDLGTHPDVPGTPLQFHASNDKMLTVRSTHRDFADDLLQTASVADLALRMPTFWIHGDRLWLSERSHVKYVHAVPADTIEAFTAAGSALIERIPSHVWQRLRAR